MYIFIFLLLFVSNIISEDLPVNTAEPTTETIVTELPNTEAVTIEPEITQEISPTEKTEIPVVETKDESVEIPAKSETPEKTEPEFEPGKLELLDKIEAEVITSTPESTGVQIITTSDIRKRAFDGGKYTLDDLVNEALADNLGKIFKINLTDDDVNKYLKRANLTDKAQLKKLTEQWGYESLEDFYENFKKIYRANSALNYEMSSQLVVLENEIQDYYDKNPVYKEANYTLETTFVLLDSTKTKEDLKKELEEFAAGKKTLDYVIWDLPVTFKKDEVPEFLKDLPVGSIYVKELNDGFDLFKLLDKQPDRLVSLEERKKEIVDKLQAKKHEEAYGKVQNDLLSKAIVYKPNEKTPENISELGL